VLVQRSENDIKDHKMLEAYKTLVTNQFEAALCTLNLCVDRCPEHLWNQPVGTYPVSLVAFHTLFFADFYLGADETSQKSQSFHKEHAAIFADYEQLEDREPVCRYEKGFIKAYLEHCRQKAHRVIAAETEATLNAPCGFPRKTFSRAELHPYNIRHIQHHAAQISLRLRLDAKVDIPWVRSGWQEF
jgi:hypothetical protein